MVVVRTKPMPRRPFLEKIKLLETYFSQIAGVMINIIIE
jgi:hypothetical protein